MTKQRIPKAAALICCAVFVGMLGSVGTMRGRQTPVPGNPCPRFGPGQDVVQPADLYSQNGVLRVSLNYNTIVDNSGGFAQAIAAGNGNGPNGTDGLQLFCFASPDGKESPTLHVWPGDNLVITLTNAIPKRTLVLDADGTINENQPGGVDNTVEAGMKVSGTPCLDSVMRAASTNIHFHGMNVAPTCGQDEVLHTVINPGHTFTYSVHIPRDEPPGLYWYHPHIHGINEGVIQGGATAAIVVEGIQNLQPAVAGLPAQVLIIRDQPVPGNPLPTIGTETPSWDLTLNYVLVSSCQSPEGPYGGACQSAASINNTSGSAFVGDFTAPVMHMRPRERQLWRVVNSASHSAITLQLVYDGQPQPLAIVGMDGVPVNSQDGTARGTTVTVDSIPLAPAARVEFIATGPAASVKNAVLQTLRVPTGPDGDNHPTRPLFKIVTSPDAPEPPVTIPNAVGTPGPQRFAGLATAQVTARRTLYFSEVLVDPTNPLGPTNFFITVDGQTPEVFSDANPPAIVTHQGAVEDWTIENRAMEVHAFHIHQIHFLLLARNGIPVPPSQQQYLDMVNIPWWTGSGPYPSVTVRMDFRGAVVGDFVYHCHFVFHSDFGMMAKIRVLPQTESLGPSDGGGASPSVDVKRVVALAEPWWPGVEPAR